MSGQEWRVDRVARRVQPLAEVTQRLRRVTRAVKKQQSTAVRPRKRETLRTFRDAVAVFRESLGVLVFDRSRDAAAIERASGDSADRREQEEGNQAKPLTLASSVTPHRRINLETPTVNSANEVDDVAESLVAQPIDGSGTSRPVMAVDDDFRCPVE
jgi:hypothetical protein